MGGITHSNHCQPHPHYSMCQNFLPFYEENTFHSSILSVSRDAGASMFWPLWMTLCASIYVFDSFEHSLRSDIKDHIGFFFNFWGNSILFPIWLHYVTFLPSVHKTTNFLHVFIYTHFHNDKSETVIKCSLYLYFPNDCCRNLKKKKKEKKHFLFVIFSWIQDTVRAEYMLHWDPTVLKIFKYKGKLTE